MRHDGMGEIILEDEDYENIEKFQEEFRALVRKYAPTYEAFWVGILQEKCSCFSPYIWND